VQVVKLLVEDASKALETSRADAERRAQEAEAAKAAWEAKQVW
jgi:hypothetical protein